MRVTEAPETLPEGLEEKEGALDQGMLRRPPEGLKRYAFLNNFLHAALLPVAVALLPVAAALLPCYPVVQK